MPSTYAHFRFGGQVLAGLSQEERRLIERHRALYDIGLHGPDVLFHYRVLTRGPVNQLGHQMHHWSGRRVFASAWDALCRQERNEASRAYFYGFLCHFSLDSICHGLIGRAQDETEFSHNEIETELDRRLMEEDGLNPFHYKPAGHFRPSLEVGDVAAATFFPVARGEQVEEAARSMKRNLGLLVAQNPFKRALLFAVLKGTGNGDLYGLVVKRERNLALDRHMQSLQILTEKAKEVAVRLIEHTDSAAFLDDEALRLNFNAQLVDESGETR